MVEGTKALLNGQEVFIEINNSKLLIKKEDSTIEKEIQLSEICSLHVKNNERYFLKLKLLQGEFIILSFETCYTRDIIKSMLLSFIKTDQDVLKKILETDLTTKTMFNNLKQHISSSKFWMINKDKVKQMSSIVRQKPPKDINVDGDFMSTLTPTLLKVFEQMNCSVKQFYNLLTQSYFWSIKNQKNSLDRMISSAIRDYNIEQDFATRINSHSILALKPIENANIQENKQVEKKVEFFPIYPFEEDTVKRMQRDFEFERTELKCDIELEEEPVVDKTIFDKKDLIWIRDLSRIVYKAKKDEDDEFVNEVTEITKKYLEKMSKKYGEEKMCCLAKIIPTYFIS